jgi:hypothetical protein
VAGAEYGATDWLWLGVGLDDGVWLGVALGVELPRALGSA